jgi:hypothetical protein
VSETIKEAKEGAIRESDRLNHHLVAASGPARDHGGKIYREGVWDESIGGDEQGNRIHISVDGDRYLQKKRHASSFV